jgi:hypothetical protein
MDPATRLWNKILVSKSVLMLSIILISILIDHLSSTSTIPQTKTLINLFVRLALARGASVLGIDQNENLGPLEVNPCVLLKYVL